MFTVLGSRLTSTLIKAYLLSETASWQSEEVPQGLCPNDWMSRARILTMKKRIVSGAALLVSVTVSPTGQADVLPEVSSHYAVDTDPRKRPPFLPAGTRLQTVGVAEFNEIGNPAHDFMFTHPDGSATLVRSPDPGRALITGVAESPFFDRVNAVKIPPLWGVRRTAPYFHDNSAKTLAAVATHYAKFFALISPPPGGGDPALVLTEQDQVDIVAYRKLLA